METRIIKILNAYDFARTAAANNAKLCTKPKDIREQENLESYSKGCLMGFIDALNLMAPEILARVALRFAPTTEETENIRH